MKARGADFSSAQTVGHVRELASRLDFAFVKATEGIGYTNPLLHDQQLTLHTAGVLVGYYHFLDPAVAGDLQWDYFENAVRPRPFAPLALDYEAAGTTDTQARAFIRRGRQRGYRVGLYGGVNICRRRLGQRWRWVAYWSTTPPPLRCDVWQFSDGGGRQDYDVFRGDKAQLERWWKRHSLHTPRHRLRWWIRAGTVSLGPYRLPLLAARLVAYALRHPRTGRLLLERK